MAEFNGIKQAVIVYKVSSTTGEPLDVNNEPTSHSGRRQAIRLLVGRGNPDPERFEVEGYFSEGDQINGVPSTGPFEDACPPGERAPWILDDGTWEMANFWVDTETWNFL